MRERRSSLTRMEAIDIAIELWEWLAEKGLPYKQYWPSWIVKYNRMAHDCPLCEFVGQDLYDIADRKLCTKCPYKEYFGKPCFHKGGHYNRWENVCLTGTRKKHARALLKQLREIKEKETNNGTKAPVGPNDPG